MIFVIHIWISVLIIYIITEQFLGKNANGHFLGHPVVPNLPFSYLGKVKKLSTLLIYFFRGITKV